MLEEIEEEPNIDKIFEHQDQRLAGPLILSLTVKPNLSNSIKPLL